MLEVPISRPVIRAHESNEPADSADRASPLYAPRLPVYQNAMHSRALLISKLWLSGSIWDRNER